MIDTLSDWLMVLFIFGELVLLLGFYVCVKDITRLCKKNKQIKEDMEMLENELYELNKKMGIDNAAGYYKTIDTKRPRG